MGKPLLHNNIKSDEIRYLQPCKTKSHYIDPCHISVFELWSNLKQYMLIPWIYWDSSAANVWLDKWVKTQHWPIYDHPWLELFISF